MPNSPLLHTKGELFTQRNQLCGVSRTWTSRPGSGLFGVEGKGKSRDIEPGRFSKNASFSRYFWGEFRVCTRAKSCAKFVLGFAALILPRFRAKKCAAAHQRVQSVDQIARRSRLQH